MSETIKVLCYKSKTLANGEHPLMLCVYKDRKRKFQSLGISVNAKYWNFKDNCLEEVPLKIHSLSRLAEKTGLDQELSEEQLDFIDRLEPLNIEARYPSYKERLMKSLSKEYCQQLLKETKELQQWIKNKL